MGISIIKNKGFSVVEVILAIGIFALFSTGITYLSIDTLQGDEKIEENSKALMYAQEGLEAVRQMRDKNYLQLSDGDHGLQIQNNIWSFIQAPEDIDSYYSRTVTIDDVFRDGDGNISDSGTLDPDIKKATSRIEWLHRGIIPKSVELTTYLSNWRGNDWIQTDCDEFNGGTFQDTEVIATLAPPDNNCAVKLSLEEEQSAILASADVGEHGNDVFVDGNYTYVATEKTHGGLAVVDITDKQHLSVVRIIDIGDKGTSVTKLGNYVYAGVDHNSKGLAVINATNPSSAALVTTKDIYGTATAITSSGSYVYVGSHGSTNKLVILNASNPVNPTIVSSPLAQGKILGIDVVGNYAYVGTDYDWQGFRIYNISNPSSPTVASNLGLNEEVNAVEVQGPYAFLGTEAGSFYVINVSNPSSPSVVKNINVDEEIQDISIQGDYAYVSLNDTGKNLAAINISTPTDPYLVYTKDVGGKGQGIATDSNYIYETIIVNNKGLVLTGTTIVGTETDGTYVSGTLDTGSSSTIYNYIRWEAPTVPGATVKFQLRTASTLSGINSATWVGSDGTASTYYENSNIPIVVSPNATGIRYIQFKAYITSDGVHTPQIESITVNYLP